MTDKEQIERLKNEIAELRETNDYYKRECNGYWAELLERKKINLAIAQKIVKTDGKAIANIILNMHFGEIPSDSCSFCEIFNLRGKGCCEDDLRCTDCIDDFLRQHYSGAGREFCEYVNGGK
ncbi:MAG: hypothetical protein HFI75_02645 [Lachnospiraceae bacterium]|nr:hypothetical protein [Lachnospiraceae bacterium]